MLAYTNVSTPLHETGDVPVRAVAAITGKRFVKATGRTGGPGLSTDLANLVTVVPCVAGDRCFGVAKYDIANTDEGGVHGQPGKEVQMTAGAAVAIGAEVQSDANGKAITLAAGKANGMATSVAAADGDDIYVKLY